MQFSHLQLGKETGAEIQCLQMQSNGWLKKKQQTPDFKYICKHTHDNELRMRHSEEERDLGSLGGKCSESTQLLGGEQCQPEAGMARAGREWRPGQEALAHLHLEHGWPWCPVSKGTQQSLQGSEEEEQQENNSCRCWFFCRKAQRWLWNCFMDSTAGKNRDTLL